jgi:ferredoxin
VSDTQWRIEISRRICIASGVCAGIAPAHFSLQGDGSHALADMVDQNDIVIDAAESCPVEAIKVFSAAGNTLIAPTD